MTGCDLLILGATRNTGLQIAKLAAERGEQIAAMVRKSSDDSALKALHVKMIQGDAFHLEDCIRAVRETQPRRVVSLMGGKDKDGRRICAIGNIHAAKALEEHQTLERFLLVTSMGCGDQYEGMSDNMKQFLGESLRAKTQAEDYLRNSKLPWTIIRPGGLENTSPSGRFHLAEKPDPSYKEYLSRGDVALAVLQLLDDPAWLHKTVTVQNATLKGE